MRLYDLNGSVEISALRLMGLPHSHDFSEGPPPDEVINQARQEA